MLTSLLILPILGVLALVSMQEETDQDKSRIKQVALMASLATFIVSMLLWGEFDSNASQYQFTTEFNHLSYCHLHLGVDALSLYFVLLTTFTMPICILASWENVRHNLKSFMIAMLVLEALLIMVFVVLDLLLFYIFFEAVLIPLFLIVGIWGASEQRVRASFMLFLYTLRGSLFMLLAFIALVYNAGTSDLQLLSLADISFANQKILWLAIFLSFCVKTPVVPLHNWLLTAHVEAPVAGSMILAGLVLKLATYGFIRVLIPLMPEATAYYTPLAYTVAIVSILYASLSALRQTDFKRLVAYSSIAHMGVSMMGLFSNTVQGIEGSIVLALGHGFVSPALFFIVGSVLYDRYHTRTMRYYRGLALFMPMAMTLFFLFILGNMGTPGISVNWVGELLSLTGAFQQNGFATLLGATSIVLSAGYSIWLFNRLAFGAFTPYLSPSNDLTRREYRVLLSLLIPMILFGLYPNIILDDLHYVVSTLITSP